ncbi:MAG: aspartate aminotransferase family protein [Anaerolineales bacterium]|nr:aspartate aminotransferase family protein [Anaerolineales bacterium]
MTNQDSTQQEQTIHQHFAPCLAEDWPRLPITRAEGIYLYTEDGRKIMDFISGIAVTNVGHNHPKVVAAAREQMEKLVHNPVGIVFSEPVLKLAETLPAVMPGGLDMFFFGNSGAEAVEGSLKMARYVTERPVIIAFKGSFHGRSYGAASVTSVKSKYRKHYEPFVPGVYFAEYPYPYRCPLGDSDEIVTGWSLKSLKDIFDHYADPSQVAAILVEPVQGEGGYIVPPAGFLPRLREICDEHGILLILDEVQSGFGRTGEMFAAQVFDVQPDILAVAKGIANGFPLSATAARSDLMSRWLAGSHGTTFGGSPISCAAALAVLEVIREDNLLANARAMGTLLLDGFRSLQVKYDLIGDVRGLGLMVAMELIVPGSDKTPDGQAAAKVLEGCLDRGLLGYMAGHDGQVVRLMPPLNVTRAQVEQALEILENSLQALG